MCNKADYSLYKTKGRLTCVLYMGVPQCSGVFGGVQGCSGFLSSKMEHLLRKHYLVQNMR
jgi:hypothetical protein